VEPRLLPAPHELELTGPGPERATAPREQRDASLPAQGYELRLAPELVELRFADDAGLRYGRASLAQLRAQSPGRLPGLRIRDWPDFPVRGYMLDVSRDRVPTRATLARIVALMDLLRLNHLQLYTEHSFAYRAHELVWRDASPLTPDDLRWLDARCVERGIELAANQNCFGHLGRWLRHAPYNARAEAPDGWRAPWSARPQPPGVLAPTEDNARFALELCQEQLACLSSRRINIGCDETFELGQGRSRAEVEARGAGRVYLDHLLRLTRGLHAGGREVLFWGDIVRSHPELVAELPARDLVALVWHYEAPCDPAAALPELLRRLALVGIAPESLRGFEYQVAPFAARGLPFWVCPGTSTWNSLVGRLPNARANLLDAARVGRAAGASGYLITDWGDNGHHQPPSVSFPPLVYGAALAWCEAANRDLPLAAMLDAHVLDDAAGELGAALERIGALAAQTGKLGYNASPLFAELLGTGPLGALGEASEPGTRAVLEQLEEAAAALERARARCVDAGAVSRELGAAIRLARHGAWRMRRAAGFSAPPTAQLQRDLAEAIEQQRQAWLERSRPGGLTDSLARLEKVRAGYG
jgi:hypothetical protein